MAKYGERLIQDLPQQFKGKERIEALLEVIGSQLDEVQAFYESLNLERALATAKGVQLDRIGSILVLTRSEAGLLIQDNEDYIIDDETYRYILAYKIMLNNGSATYYDIVRGIKQFYNLDISYSETPDEPAAFTLEVGVADANVPLRNILPVKAAGVLCYYSFRLGGDRDAIKVSTELSSFKYELLECGMPLCGTQWKTATLGRSDNYEVNASGGTEGFSYKPDFTGTIPQTATLGQNEGDINLKVSLTADGFVDGSAVCGSVRSGMMP